MTNQAGWFIHFTGTNKTLPSTEKDCKSLIRAHNILVAAFEIEVLFDILLESYREVEKFGLFNSLRWCTEEHLDNLLELARRRAQANTTVMLALTAQKTYRDQVKRHLKIVCGNTKGKNYFKDRWETLEETVPEMLLVRAIRNHTQHGGMPVSSLRSGHRSNESEIYTQLIMSIVDAGRDNPQFADEIRSLSKSIPRDVELMHILRVMIHNLNELHKELRSLFIEPATLSAIHIITDASKEFSTDQWTQYPLVIIEQDPEKTRPRKDTIVSLAAYRSFEKLAQTNCFKYRPVSERIVQRLHADSLIDPHVYPS